MKMQGSIKTPLNYKRSDQAIPDRDVRESVKERAKEVKYYKSSKLLGIHATQWMNGTKPTEQVLFRPTSVHLCRDRKNGFDYNYRSEVPLATIPEPEKRRKTKFCLPETNALASSSSSSSLRRKHMEGFDKRGKTGDISVNEWEDDEWRGTTGYAPNATAYKLHKNKATHDRFLAGRLPRTTEAPTHPRLMEKDEWVPTTGNLDYKEIANVLENKTKKSMRNSRARTADMSLKRPLISKREYRSPIQQQSDLNKKVRSHKVAGTFWQSLKPKRDDPNSKISEFSKNLFENRFALEPARYTQRQFHSGVWELNKKEGKYMWSDTGSFIYHDPGDVRILTKLDRMNHEGPTLPMETYYSASKRINLIE